jgi:hypothetical protein
MIGSIAVISTLLAVPAAADVRAPRIEIPDVHVKVPVEVPLPDFDFPDFDFSEFPLALHSLQPGALAARDDQDEEEDDEDRADHDAKRGERDRHDWSRDFQDEMRWRDEPGYSSGPPTARAQGKDGSASLSVKGPVTFRLRVQAGEADVVGTNKSQVAVTVSGTTRDELQLLQYGDRVEAEFSGRGQLPHGRIRVELPKGSSVEFSSTSGDVSVQDIGGDVRVRTMSGDVKITGARTANVNSISSDVNVNVTGPKLRLHVVSGNVVAATSDPGVHLDFESASGGLDWTGVCAKGCRLRAQTVSGDIKLQPDAAKSSFELSYASHSGDLRDELKLDVKRSRTRKHGNMSGWLDAVYGKGEGVIECDAFSGDLIVKKR